MSEKHTPGPWEADFGESDDYRVRVFGGEGIDRGAVEVCVVYSDEDSVPHATPEERDANARLIAAAPDLLAALTRYVEQEERAAPYSSSPLREAARAALAKAVRS